MGVKDDMEEKKTGRSCDTMLMERVFAMDDYQTAAPRLIVRLLSACRTNVPGQGYRRIGDIAMVLYLILDECEGHLVSMRVSARQFRKWNRQEEDLFQTAMNNTILRDPPRLYRLETLLSGENQEGQAFMDKADPFCLSSGVCGDCLTTERKLNGAVAAFYPGVAERLSEIMGSDFFFAFTSMHEVMLHPLESASPEVLKEILEETIHEATGAEDFLSYGIFRYFREDDTIRQVL